MTDYPKWQEAIRAAQADKREKERISHEQWTRKQESQASSKLTALGTFLDSLGLDVSTASTYKEDNGQEQGFVFGNFKFCVLTFNYQDKLIIRPVLTKEDDELFDTAGIEWFRYSIDDYSYGNEVIDKSEFKKFEDEQTTDRFIIGYEPKNTRESLQAWIANEIDNIEQAIVRAREAAHAKLNKEGKEALAELNIKPIIIDPETNKIVEGILALVRREISEHCEYYHAND